MEAAKSSETLVSYRNTIRSHIAEDLNLIIKFIYALEYSDIGWFFYWLVIQQGSISYKVHLSSNGSIVTAFRTAVGLKQLSIQWISMALHPGVKATGA